VADDLNERDRADFLAHLFQVLKRHKDTLPGSVEYLQNAKVPIVKFVDKISGQHCDISFNSKGSGAVETIQKYSHRYPAFKYLVILVKYFMKQRGLNEVFTGGISSYSLSLMVISHLQMHTSNYEKDFVPLTSLGTLLIDFFALYGIYFNYKRVAIEITQGGIYREKDLYEMRNCPERLVLIDPCNSDNNVSSGTFNIKGIQDSFYSAFCMLTSNTMNESPSILSRLININKELVDRRIIVMGDESYIPPFIEAPIRQNKRKRDDELARNKNKKRK
jgi:non-canonical poly(A) RNA polymerase PAPD5/7